MRIVKLGRLTVEFEGFEFGKAALPDDPNAELLDAVPRLKRKGKVQFGGLQRLVHEDGWTVDEINRIVDAFPAISYLPLTLLVSVAGGIRRNGVASVDDVLRWLQAMLEPPVDDRLLPRKVVSDELDHRRQDGSRMADIPAMWIDAAGSPEAGLAALSDGLSLADTTARYLAR